MWHHGHLITASHLIRGSMGTRESSPRTELSIGSSVFAQLSRVPNTQTTLHHDVYSNSPPLRLTNDNDRRGIRSGPCKQNYKTAEELLSSFLRARRYVIRKFTYLQK